MLNGDDAPGREAFPVADSVNLVNDGDFGIATKEKIGVQGVWLPFGLDGAARGYQGLSDDLSAENSLPARLRRASAK